MTPRELAMARATRWAARLEPRLARAVLRALRSLADAPLAELARRLERDPPDEVLAWLVGRDEARAAWRDLRAAYAESVRETAETAARTIPIRVTVRIVPTDPALTRLVQRWTDGAFAAIQSDVLAGLRTLLADRLATGIGPRQAAAALREAVAAGALTAYDERIIASFRAALESGRTGEALGRLLRHRRYDAMLRRGDLTPAQIDAMVAAYRRRLVTFRAETLARTAAMQAANDASLAAWRQAAADGLVDPAQVRRHWVVADDERLCEVCEPIPNLNPGGVGLDEPFRTPIGALDGPTAHPRCRCTTWVRLVRPGVVPRPAPGTTRLILPRVRT